MRAMGMPMRMMWAKNPLARSIQEKTAFGFLGTAESGTTTRFMKK
jgi:hypothetical protein